MKIFGKNNFLSFVLKNCGKLREKQTVLMAQAVEWELRNKKHLWRHEGNVFIFIQKEIKIHFFFFTEENRWVKNFHIYPIFRKKRKADDKNATCWAFECGKTCQHENGKKKIFLFSHFHSLFPFSFSIVVDYYVHIFSTMQFYALYLCLKPCDHRQQKFFHTQFYCMYIHEKTGENAF